MKVERDADGNITKKITLTVSQFQNNLCLSVNLTINKLVYNHRIQSNKNFLLHKLKFKSLTPFL